MGQKLGRDAFAAIRDDDFQVRIHPFQRYLYSAVLRREFEGIAQEIPDDLLQPAGITLYRASYRIERHLKSHALRFAGRADTCHGGFDHAGKLHPLHVEADFPRDDPAHIQQIFNQLLLQASIACNHLDAFGHAFREVFGLQKTCPAEDRVEGCSQFV